MIAQRIASFFVFAIFAACGEPPGENEAKPAPIPPVVDKEIPAPEIVITPDVVELIPGATYQFKALAKGTEDIVEVKWSVQESGGGTVDGGYYQAPPNARTGIFHLKAVSSAAATQTATATITIQNAVATQVAAAAQSTCALSNQGKVSCWGDNEFAQLGDGTSTQRSLPVSVQGIEGTVTAISTGWFHACALTATGYVYCWGSGKGNGSPTGTKLSQAAVVAGLSGVASLSLGALHSCVLLNTGAVKCWGHNLAPESTHGAGRHGQLGSGTTADSATPMAAMGITNATGISSGAYHTCAVLATGAMQCWGVYYYGNLGNGTTGDKLSPTSVQGLAGPVSQATAGYGHTCALLLDGTAQCWGSNQMNPTLAFMYGQIGSGANVSSYALPTTVVTLAGSTAITAGGFHTCASAASGMSCWGSSVYGGLGNGVESMSSETSPDAVLNMTAPPVSISAGYLHTCAVIADGAVQCWGDNQYAQLGDGSENNKYVPANVLGFGP